MRITEQDEKKLRQQKRFAGLKTPKNRIKLSSPLLHGTEQGFFEHTLEVDTDQVIALEGIIAKYIGIKKAAAVSSVSAAVHFALKLAAEKIYASSSGISTPGGTGRGGALFGRRVFCPDFAPAEIVNPILYEGGEPIFIDASPLDWGMDPEVLSLAFERYPDVRIVIASHIYGFTARMEEIKRICRENGAILIEDASSAFGAKAGNRRAGSIGDYGILGFDREAIITGYGGAAVLMQEEYGYHKVKYWASGSCAKAPWNQHEELGYGCQMSGLTAAMIGSQLVHVKEHIAKKMEIYNYYKERIGQDLMPLNPVLEGDEPNYCISAMLIDSGICFSEVRSEREYAYESFGGTASPMEIYEALEAFQVESRPVYKPMHLQPLYRIYEQMTLDGGILRYENFFQDDFALRCNRSAELFQRGLCLPSDLRMTREEQDLVIDIIYACLDGMA